MYVLDIITYMAGDRLLSSLQHSPHAPLSSQPLADPGLLQHIALLMILFTSWGTVLLAGSLYMLLRRWGPALALFALLWRTAEIVLGAVSSVLSFAALDLPPRGSSDLPQLNPDVIGHISAQISKEATSVADVFFAAGSTLFFFLFLRSKALPTAISLLGVIASIWVAAIGLFSLAGLGAPSGLAFGWLAILIAELAAGLWLLVVGPKVNAPTEDRRSSG